MGMSKEIKGAIPGPRGPRLIGSLIEIRRNRLNFVIEAAGRYGSIVGFRMDPRRIYLLTTLTMPSTFSATIINYRKGLGLIEAKPLLGAGLLTTEGEQGASHRRLLQPSYYAQHLEHFSSAIVTSTLSVLERWEALAVSGAPLDIVREMARLTLNILGVTQFRTDFAGVSDQL